MLGVFVDLDRLLLDLSDLCLLLHDLLVQLCKEQRELAHCLFDTLDIVVASANGAENAGGLTATVALELQNDVSRRSSRLVRFHKKWRVVQAYLQLV
jgi:hypothetical protein